MYFYSQNLRDTQPKVKLNIIRYQVIKPFKDCRK